MKMKLCVIIFCVFAFLNPAFAEPLLPNPAKLQIYELPRITRHDRVLILAPHPDDEIIGCAGIIQQAVRDGVDIHIAYLTNGEHNQFAFIVYKKYIPLSQAAFIQLGELRKNEAIKATQYLGIAEDKLIFLGYPDFGTFTILKDYWQTSQPYQTILTRISRVPYKGQFSYGAPYIGESILADLERVLEMYQPTKIFVSHPADVNGDHKALYLFLQIALRNLPEEIPRPQVYPYLVHWVGWPMPRRYHPEVRILPPAQFAGSATKWYKHNLTGKQIKNKYKALLFNKSQTESSYFYLSAFVRKNELFGDYPEMYLTPGHYEEILWAKPQASLLSSVLRSFLFLNFTAKKPDPAAQKKIVYKLEGDYFVIQLLSSHKISQQIGLVAYIFGYSKTTHFENMPKIRVISRYKRLYITDGEKRIKGSKAEFKFDDNELIIKLPLKLLGNPDFMLISLKDMQKTFPPDATGFRKVNMKLRRL